MKRNLNYLPKGIPQSTFGRLSKTFDWIVHDLLKAKIDAYSSDYNSLKLINSFLSVRKFRFTVDSSYSPYLNLFVSVTKGSVMGTLLFNVYISDLFLCDSQSNIINYAGDTILYACEQNTGFVLGKLDKEAFTVFAWF